MGIKIAYLVDQFPALSETFILHQITGMIDRGHEVDIYANHIGNRSKIHPEVEHYQLLEKTHYLEVPSNYLFRGINAFNIIGNHISKKSNVWLHSLNIFKYGRQAISLKLLHSASRFLQKPSYDIIHCQLGFLGLQGLLFKDIGVFQGKLIVSFRGADLSVYIHKYGEHVYKRLFERGDVFLPVSESMQRKLIDLGCDEKKIIIHRSGLDLESFDSQPPPYRFDEKVRLVTVGRLVEKKGIKYAIKAVAQLVKFYPHIEYQIIGEGPLLGELQQLIQELGLEVFVKAIGWKNKPEVIEILKNSDILVAPSVTSHDGDQEGIPNVLKEAMVMGLPVVSTLHSGIPELVEDGVSGFLVPERDVDTLAQKLDYLIHHPERCTEMGSAGRAYVREHYDLNNLNDRLAEIYKTSISCSGH
ncbi:MAG: glycosyltransferase [Planktothrix sp.]